MTKPPARARRASDEQASQAERADALIAMLESQIAYDAKARARLLGMLAAPGLVEPHRDHHAYALGADQADCELATGDARAMRGLMSIGPAALADLLEEVGRTAPAAHVTRLWSGILATDRERFAARGAAVDAKRLAYSGDGASDQQTVFEAALSRVGVSEVHRDQRAFTLGADLFFCGLTTQDAMAMLGLMSIGPLRLAGQLRDAGGSEKNTYVTRLWACILTRQREEYEARGQLVRWQRRWARYNVEFEAWLASPQRHEDGWREKPMTARQRHLVRDTAIITGRIIPEEMGCGAAHDWLMATGANALYRKEK